jgi:hypothetical protein
VLVLKELEEKKARGVELTEGEQAIIKDIIKFQYLNNNMVPVTGLDMKFEKFVFEQAERQALGAHFHSID